MPDTVPDTQEVICKYFWNEQMFNKGMATCCGKQTEKMWETFTEKTGFDLES